MNNKCSTDVKKNDPGDINDVAISICWFIILVCCFFMSLTGILGSIYMETLFIKNFLSIF